MTETSAKIICDSISPAGHRFTTYECVYPRLMLAEVNTHRALSRVSASSRAVPIEKMIKRVLEDPYVPIHWGKNQKGMRADQDIDAEEAVKASGRWKVASFAAIRYVQDLLAIGVHKQISNRLLEPFMWHPTVISGTEYSNLFNLRDHKDAFPDFRDLAHMMRELYGKSEPKLINYNEWHAPYIQHNELLAFSMNATVDEMWSNACKVSVGRCARVSSLTHDGKHDFKADINLHDKMMVGGHMSPYENVARPMTPIELEIFKQKKMRWDTQNNNWQWVGSQTIYNDEDNTVAVIPGKYTYFLGNVQGWVQMRKMVPFEEDILSPDAMR